MRKFFSRNIDPCGRLVRGIGSGLFVIGGIAIFGGNGWAAVGLILFGGFMCARSDAVGG